MGNSPRIVLLYGNVVGDKGEPNLTEEEQADGFEITWAESIDEAIDLLESDHPQVYEGLFIRERDLTFLKTAKVAINLSQTHNKGIT